MQVAIDNLPNLRLPELQATYAEVTGEQTRCPNKKFLIRRITESLQEQPEPSPAASETSKAAEIGTSGDPPAASETIEAVEPGASGDPPAASETIEAAEPGDSGDPPAASETIEAAEPGASADSPAASETIESAEPGASADQPAASETIEATQTPLTKLSVKQLQALYLEVVGRPTGSDHRRYLIWKIRQAQKGKIPIGPRKRRDPDDPASAFKILPLRLPAEQVQSLDEARQRLGLKSRMDLFRRALNVYFDIKGEQQVAELFATGS